MEIWKKEEISWKEELSHPCRKDWVQHGIAEHLRGTCIILAMQSGKTPVLKQQQNSSSKGSGRSPWQKMSKNIMDRWHQVWTGGNMNVATNLAGTETHDRLSYQDHSSAFGHRLTLTRGERDRERWPKSFFVMLSIWDFCIIFSCASWEESLNASSPYSTLMLCTKPKEIFNYINKSVIKPNTTKILILC